MRGLCAVVAALVALASSAAPAPAAEPYDIPVVLPLTGSGAFLGQGEKRSLELAEALVNSTGGLQGRTLRYVYHDDQSSPQIGVQLAGEIVAQSPSVMLGSSLVAICRAIVPLVAKNGPVQYCFSPGLHPEAGAYSFTASVSTVDLADAVIRYFRLKGWHRVALMFSTDATGQDAEDGITRVLALADNKEMQVVANAHFNTADVSVAAQMETIKAANPDCFIAWSTGTPIATIFRAMLQAGLDVPMATTDGNMTYAQMTQYADFLPRQLYIPAGEFIARDAADLPPGVVAAHREFYRVFDAAGVKPDEPSELAWEPAMMIVHALRTLGPNATAQQVRDLVGSLQGYAGIDGLYDFKKSPQRGLDVSNAVVTRWNQAKLDFEVVSQPGGAPIH